jgi:hypothetical protein
VLAFLKEGLDSWASNYFTNPLVAFPVAVPLCCFRVKEMKSFVVNRPLAHIGFQARITRRPTHAYIYAHCRPCVSFFYIANNTI